jgi:hypothetical protein
LSGTRRGCTNRGRFGPGRAGARPAPACQIMAGTAMAHCVLRPKAAPKEKPQGWSASPALPLCQQGYRELAEDLGHG